MTTVASRLGLGAACLVAAVWWRLRRPQERQAEPGAPEATVEDQREILKILIDQTRGRISGQSSDSEALDTKAIGLVAVAAAGITLLVTTHSSLNDLWWIPALALGLASAPMLWVVWPRAFDTGPAITDFYERFGAMRALDAERQMLAELLLSVERNDNTLPREQTVFKIGFAAFLVAAAASIVPALFPEEPSTRGRPAPAATVPTDTLRTITHPARTMTTTNSKPPQVPSRTTTGG